jgi:hypothetical protein
MHRTRAEFEVASGRLRQAEHEAAVPVKGSMFQYVYDGSVTEVVHWVKIGRQQRGFKISWGAPFVKP